MRTPAQLYRPSPRPYHGLPKFEYAFPDKTRIFALGVNGDGRRVASAFIATAFAQDATEAAKTQWRRVTDQLRPKLPKLSALLDEAEANVLAYITFPAPHRAKLHATNPIERVNGEILLEQSDEWTVRRARYMTLETIAALSAVAAVSLPTVPG